MEGLADFLWNTWAATFMLLWIYDLYNRWDGRWRSFSG